MKNILVLALLAAVCLGCGIMGGKKDELTDISEIKREYAKSKDEAQKKYDGKELTIEAPLPKDLKATLQQLRK